MQSLGSAQNEKLRGIIHEHMKGSNLYGHVRSFVRDFIAQEQGVALDEDKLLTALHEKRIIEELIGSLGKEPDRLSAKSVAALPSKGSGRYLHLRVNGGSAFVDQVFDSNEASGSLVAHFFFAGQRHSTKPVPCCTDPEFDDGFLFKLEGADVDSLAALSEPIHIVIVQQSVDDRCHVIGTQSVEWRRLLVTGYLKLVTELCGIGGDTTVPVGVISLHMEFLPKVTSNFKGAEAVDLVLKEEKEREAERERKFFNMARQWWKEFLQIRPEHSARTLKIFARTETDVVVPVLSFIRPLNPGRALKSAGQAARFVSLIEFERVAVLGNAGTSEVWADMHTTLASRKGDAEAHATLLCSLLLGFRLEAYCAMGTTSAGEPHMWVVTLDRQEPELPPKAVFWESLFGTRYAHTGGGNSDSNSALHTYGRIGCVFNHECFYGNVQADDSVAGCRFDLDDISSWKAMDRTAIEALSHSRRATCAPPPIIHHPMATDSMEEALEASLRQLISDQRRGDGLATHWDTQLSFLLAPALLSSENEKVTGSAAGAADFRQGLRNAIPAEFSFKGFPMQFSHLCAPRMLQDLCRNPVAAGIVRMQGGVDSVRFALRTQVVAYPERVCAVWVMLAVVFAKI